MYTPHTRAIITTPTPSLQKQSRFWFVSIASACRNTDAWPTPANYQTTLPDVYRSVTSLVITQACVRATEYTVDEWNDGIDIHIPHEPTTHNDRHTQATKDNGTIVSARAAHGNYTQGTALASAVQAALHSASPLLTSIHVEYDLPTHTLRIISKTTVHDGTTYDPVPFTLMWRSGPQTATSMARTMGFDLVDVHAQQTHGGVYHIQASGQIDLATIQGVDVFVDELEHALNGQPLAHIPLVPHTHAPSYTAPHPQHNHTLHSFWPILKLSSLTFRLCVPYVEVHMSRHNNTSSHATFIKKYRPFQTHGVNHTLQIEVGCVQYENPHECTVEIDTNA